jgi:hypothetical protein
MTVINAPTSIAASELTIGTKREPPKKPRKLRKRDLIEPMM